MDPRDLLRLGVAAWNRWRLDHPHARPNVGDIKLNDAELVGVDFSRCVFAEASFPAANLYQANFDGAIAQKCVFDDAFMMDVSARGADFTAASFRNAFLRQSNFTSVMALGADFSRADLQFVNFSRANLRRSIFDEAILGETLFNDTDATGLVGTSSARHAGHTVIDDRTIGQSTDMSREFLESCGLPELIVENLASLRGKPIEFYSCFISYSVSDEEFASRLHSELKLNNIRTWFAPEDLHIGEKFRQAIDRAIRIRDKLLLVLSENALASTWVADEVETAFEEEVRRGKPILFPIRLDDAVMNTDESWAATIRRTRHIGDFRRWKDHDAYKMAFQRLLRDLKIETQREALENLT